MKLYFPVPVFQHFAFVWFSDDARDLFVSSWSVLILAYVRNESSDIIDTGEVELDKCHSVGPSYRAVLVWTLLAALKVVIIKFLLKGVAKVAEVVLCAWPLRGVIWRRSILLAKANSKFALMVLVQVLN